MSRFLVMALLASCSLAQGAMASTKLTPDVDLILINSSLAPELRSAIIVTAPLECGQDFFTIKVPKAPFVNGQPKYYNMIYLYVNAVGGKEYHVLEKDETSFTRSGVKPKVRFDIRLVPVQLRPDGTYGYFVGAGHGSTFQQFYHSDTTKVCKTR